jgi:hypothetical protein
MVVILLIINIIFPKIKEGIYPVYSKKAIKFIVRQEAFLVVYSSPFFWIIEHDVFLSLEI